jgi:hypothetical protein
LRRQEKGYKPNWHKFLDSLGLAGIVLLAANKSRSEAAPGSASDMQAVAN